MAVDLSLSALVNAGGSFLFFLAGVAIVILGRATRRLLDRLRAQLGLSADDAGAMEHDINFARGVT